MNIFEERTGKNVAISTLTERNNENAFLTLAKAAAKVNRLLGLSVKKLGGGTFVYIIFCEALRNRWTFVNGKFG